MKLSLLTWNGHNINDNNPFMAAIPVGQLSNLNKNAVLVNRALDYPFLSTVVKNANVLVIQVYIKGDENNINTNRELLKQYFFGDDLRHNIVALDEQSGNQVYRRGYATLLASQGENMPQAFVITITTEYPYWQLVTATADSWEITASGDSDTITNIGNIPVKPVFTITPTVTKTAGLKYSRYVPVYNNLDRSYISPYELTNGGLDVQTLIDADKMQANGNDFRVWEWDNGAFVDRWLYGMDSDSDPAFCWLNLSLSPRKEGTTNATFDSDDTTLSFAQTRANLSFLRELKSVANRTLLIEAEATAFDPANIDFLNYQITNMERGVKNTVAVSHSTSSTVRYIERDYSILYGDSDLGTLSTDDNFKPIFDLSSSNLNWSYTYYYQKYINRPGAWQPEVLATKTQLSYNYTDSMDTFVDPSAPARVMGMAMVGTKDFQVANEAGTIDWLFHHPAGVTNIAGGLSYNTLDSDNSWPATVGFQYLQPDATWVTAFTDSNFPAQSSDSWVSSDSFDVSLGGTYETVRFVMDGQLNSVVNAKALSEFTVDPVTFDSDNLPTSSLGDEFSINFFDFTLTNVTSGEYIRVQTPCPVDMALTIDCENKLAYLADGSRVNVVLSSNREAWLDLLPGANNLTYVDTGTAGVSVTITHRDRNL